MNSVPLNHLLKIGAEALSTTAQTLCGAVNELKTAIAGKQDTLTFDDAPTANSSNPVKSSGIKSALDGKSNTGHTHTTSDITNFPAINDGVLTVQQNGTSKGTFSANASSNTTVNIATDEWTEEQVCATGATSKTFTDLNENYAYVPYFACADGQAAPQINSQVATGTSITITFTAVTSAQAGANDDSCVLKLRIVK